MVFACTSPSTFQQLLPLCCSHYFLFYSFRVCVPCLLLFLLVCPPYNIHAVHCSLLPLTIPIASGEASRVMGSFTFSSTSLSCLLNFVRVYPSCVNGLSAVPKSRYFHSPNSLDCTLDRRCPPSFPASFQVFFPRSTTFPLCPFPPFSPPYLAPRPAAAVYDFGAPRAYQLSCFAPFFFPALLCRPPNFGGRVRSGAPASRGVKGCAHRERNVGSTFFPFFPLVALSSTGVKIFVPASSSASSSLSPQRFPRLPASSPPFPSLSSFGVLSGSFSSADTGVELLSPIAPSTLGLSRVRRSRSRSDASSNSLNCALLFCSLPKERERGSKGRKEKDSWSGWFPLRFWRRRRRLVEGIVPVLYSN